MGSQPSSIANLAGVRDAPRHVLEALPRTPRRTARGDLRREPVAAITRFARSIIEISSVLPMLKTSPVRLLARHQVRPARRRRRRRGRSSALGAVAEDRHRLAGERLADERRHHHPVAAGLPRAHGVEEPGDDDRQPALLPVGEPEVLVEALEQAYDQRPLNVGPRTRSPSSRNGRSCSCRRPRWSRRGTPASSSCSPARGRSRCRGRWSRSSALGSRRSARPRPQRRGGRRRPPRRRARQRPRGSTAESMVYSNPRLGFRWRTLSIDRSRDRPGRGPRRPRASSVFGEMASDEPRPAGDQVAHRSESMVITFVPPRRLRCGPITHRSDTPPTDHNQRERPTVARSPGSLKVCWSMAHLLRPRSRPGHWPHVIHPHTLHCSGCLTWVDRDYVRWLRPALRRRRTPVADFSTVWSTRPGIPLGGALGSIGSYGPSASANVLARAILVQELESKDHLTGKIFGPDRLAEDVP